MNSIIYVSDNPEKYPDDFHSIQDAIATIPKENKERVTIFLRKGTYNEKIVIDRPLITLEGEDVEETIITYDDYALMQMEDGSKRGTFRTPTVFIDADDFIAKNILFENSAGYGKEVGQALALYVDGDRIIFDNCYMIASQDTLFTAPLPPTAYQIGGFTGPKEFSERRNGRHYYHNCFIRGDVDFIFGGATAYFEDCEIFSQKTDTLPPAANISEQKVYGYITAASTPENIPYGYVFQHCTLTSNCPKSSIYLGRPWRNFAKTVFMNCEMGEHIKDEGWHDWNKPEAHDTLFYAEYNNTGAGAQAAALGKRASFSKQLTKEEAENFTKEKVLAGTDGWNPVLS